MDPDVLSSNTNFYYVYACDKQNNFTLKVNAKLIVIKNFLQISVHNIILLLMDLTT